MMARIAKLGIAGLVIAVIAWMATQMRFEETEVPVPLRGEAARNPFYAAIALARELGGEASWEHAFLDPPTDSRVVVLSAWNWTLSSARRERIQRWVDAGGRLVVDASLVGDDEGFEDWSGIRVVVHDDEPEEDSPGEAAGEFLSRLMPRRCSLLTGPDGEGTLEVCGLLEDRSLTNTRPVSWSLLDGERAQVMRTAVGRGSVTVINGTPFRHRALLDGQHAELLVQATQMRRGDALLFLTEAERASLVALLWRHGAPAVLLLGAAIALALWRSAARFGPMIAALGRARRSLAEQIRGTGQFALRLGGGVALHAATARALRDAAVRRLPAYDQMANEDRVAALARASGLAADDLGPALDFSGSRSSHELRHAIAVLETARRRLLMNTRAAHGNRIQHH
jgi:hypothetical protein